MVPNHWVKSDTNGIKYPKLDLIAIHFAYNYLIIGSSVHVEVPETTAYFSKCVTALLKSLKGGGNFLA